MTDHHLLRADLLVLEIVHTDSMPWSPSPSPGVERKRLWLEGPAEAGRVTSVVRYAPGSRFPSHPHPDGEEILVLEGVFSDERGDHSAGTYLLNPQGYAHAPFSGPGCTLFVKLRQYPGLDRAQIRVDTNAASWDPYVAAGVERLRLYGESAHPETMHLLRIEAHAEVPSVALPGGEEMFVIEGSLSDEHGHYRAGTWVRYPPGTQVTVRTDTGCKVFVKQGHLHPARGPRDVILQST
ncbi:MAG: cupin domain-containing protein [Nannocystaceae bacterium]